jgi:CcmD family protein
MQYLEYMTAAYIIIWVAIMLYMLSLSKREKAIWEELQNLRATMTRSENSSDQA